MGGGEILVFERVECLTARLLPEAGWVKIATDRDSYMNALKSIEEKKDCWFERHATLCKLKTKKVHGN